MRSVLCAAVRAVIVACLGASAQAQQAAPVSSFTDSVGINVHLASQDSAYEDLSRVRTVLKQLHIRHIRDGLLNSNVEAYYTGLKLLARDGVHSLLFADVSETEMMLRGFPARAPGSMEGIEAPSEVDASSDRWLSEVRESQALITRVVGDTPMFTVGPALTRSGSFTQFGTQPCGCMFGNLHNYFGSQNPGTAGREPDGVGSYDWTMKLAKDAFGEQPVMTTESGYTADPTMPNGLPEDVAGKYTVRLLLEQFLHGIKRTYLYELIDMEIPDRGIRDHDGLLRADFSPRPAFTAVAALMGLLQDSSGAALSEADAAAQDVVPMTWKLEASTEDIHSLALRKSNGDTVLLLWREVPGYDVTTRKTLPVSSQPATLTLLGNGLPAALHFATSGALRPMQLTHSRTVTVAVDDRPIAILMPASQRVLPAPKARPHAHTR